MEPRGRPGSRRRLPHRLAAALAPLGISLVALLAAWALRAPPAVALPGLAGAALSTRAASAGTRPAEPQDPRPAEAEPARRPGGARADAALRREGRDFIAGGFLSLPPSFASEDGAYDLVIHFHGNAALAEESYHASGVNAAVLILNHGNGSSAYEHRFFHPAVLSGVLREVRAALAARGLEGARQRRLSLSSWSAGYGAVLRALAQPELCDSIDAALLLDGLHVGYDGDRAPALDRLAPLQRFARRALAGERLLVITHSEVRPEGDYAGTGEVTDALLAALGVRRAPLAEWPPLPALASLQGVLPRRLLRPLDPLTQARSGGLVVRGYAGGREQHHVMHLAQMSVIALPELARFWGRP